MIRLRKLDKDPTLKVFILFRTLIRDTCFFEINLDFSEKCNLDKN